MSDSEVVVTGQIRTVVNGSQQAFHRFACWLSADHLAVQIDGCGRDCLCHPPIPSDDPAVISYFHLLRLPLTQPE